jgi:hypothetical protein
MDEEDHYSETNSDDDDYKPKKSKEKQEPNMKV